MAKKSKPVDKQAFIARKLSVLNQKSGAQFERTAVRVVENNRPDMNQKENPKETKKEG